MSIQQNSKYAQPGCNNPQWLLQKRVARLARPAAKQKGITIKSLRDYKSNLYSALSRDLSDFEKNFLLITAGILAFSITFIRDIVKLDAVDKLWTLYLGWGLIALSIGLMMITFLTSAYGSDDLTKAIDQFLGEINKWQDDDILTEERFADIKGRTDKILWDRKDLLKVLRYAAIGSFLAGLAIFGYFIEHNMQAQNASKIKENKPAVIFHKKTNLLEVNGGKVTSNDTILVVP